MKKFQNEQHERLHNALINAGFADCSGKNMPNVKDSWNYSYINKQLDEYIYFNICEDDDVYIRHISNNEPTAFYGNSVDNIITHYESLGQTQPITKDNIAEVLKFNNITDISVHTNSLGKKHCFSLSMKPDNWLDTLEAIVGKLKPLPRNEVIELKVGDLVEFEEVAPQTIKGINYTDQEVYFDNNYFLDFKVLNNGRIKSVNGKSGIYKIPEFNFEQYLLDNGFKVEQGQHGVVLRSYVSIYKSELITDGKWTYQGVCIQETLQNADILISMANLAKDLK